MDDNLLWTDFRGYVFVNTALSSIQKGVQGAHALMELTYQYSNKLQIQQWNKLHSWRENDKTLIFLDGGFHQSILNNYAILSLQCENLELPHAIFYEDVETMNGMATAFAAIIPNTIYDMDTDEYDAMCTSMFLQGFQSPPEPDDVSLCRFLKHFKLAV